MIWLKKAKEYLAAYSCGDLEILENFYADDVKLEISGYNAVGKDALLKNHFDAKQSGTSVNVNINNTAYNDKTIFIECTLEVSSKCCKPTKDEAIILIQFNDFGKISVLKFYSKKG